MDWKHILSFRLFARAADKRYLTESGVVALFPSLKRVAKLFGRGAAGGFDLGGAPGEPGRNYRLLGRNWRGPVYFLDKNHQRDLQYITEQTRSFVRTNVPLARGFGALAQEERRNGAGAMLIPALKQTFMIALALLLPVLTAVGISVAMSASWMPTVVFILALFLLGLALRAYLQGRGKMTLSYGVSIVLLVGGFAAVGYTLDWRLTDSMLRRVPHVIWSQDVVVALVVSLLLLMALGACLRRWTIAIVGCLLCAALCIAVVLFLKLSHWLRFLPLPRWVTHVEPADIAVVGVIALVVFIFACVFHAVRQGGPREMVLLRLRDLLESGHDLSEAMRRLPRFFPRFHADLVEAGETTGRLEACLAELCEEMGTKRETAGQIRGAFLYFGVVALVQAGIVVFLLVRVIPVFYEITTEFGSEVYTPVISAILNTVDMLFEARWHGALVRVDGLQATVVAAVGVMLMLLVTRGMRKRRRNSSSRPLAALLLFVPGLRGLVMQDNFAVITCALEKLLRAGIPLDAALGKVSTGDLNPLYARMLRRVRARILEGESFPDAFKAASSGLLVPASFTSLTAVGVQSNMLPEALAYLHSFYRMRAGVRTRILVDVVKPLGVVVLGLATLLFLVDIFALLVGVSDSIIYSM